MRDATELGASLYIPATHPDLSQVACGKKLSEVRSVIFCTEDSIRAAELPLALRKLAESLPVLHCTATQMRFVRVRDPATLRQILAMPGSDRLDGFVLPKLTKQVLPEYLRLLKGHRYFIMPTIETREAFDEREMIALCRILEGKGVRERVLTLRIGGNDLLSLLGMRRPRGRTLYETPLGPVISRLVTTFKPSGFNLSAPVFEYLDDPATLRREVEEDLAYGLVGKTAIHPHQVPLIHDCYRVHAADLEMADRILCEDAPAVFRLHDAMCEPATHHNWARRLRLAASCYGLHTANTSSALA
ncbi:MAG: HpcH/HpaI aldolase/citrate lyase family protein [Azoarcus sp.]|jgi:citrate lyase beta subunit|nr:HpcH/HpaI aldolase/citrate lyase family protein [Azoarcus sp.]